MHGTRREATETVEQDPSWKQQPGLYNGPVAEFDVVAYEFDRAKNEARPLGPDNGRIHLTGLKCSKRNRHRWLGTTEGGVHVNALIRTDGSMPVISESGQHFNAGSIPKPDLSVAWAAWDFSTGQEADRLFIFEFSSTAARDQMIFTNRRMRQILNSRNISSSSSVDKQHLMQLLQKYAIKKKAENQAKYANKSIKDLIKETIAQCKGRTDRLYAALKKQDLE